MHFSFWSTSGLHPTTKRVRTELRTAQRSWHCWRTLYHHAAVMWVSRDGARRDREIEHASCVCALPQQMFALCYSYVDLHFMTVEYISIHFATAAFCPFDDSCIWFHFTADAFCVIFSSSILSFDDRNVYLYPIFLTMLQQVAESRGHLVCSVTSCTVTLVLCWKQEESGITTLYLVLFCREEKEK